VGRRCRAPRRRQRSSSPWSSDPGVPSPDPPPRMSVVVGRASTPPVVRVPQARRSSPLVTPTSLPAGSGLRVLRQRRGRLRPSSPRLLGRCRRRRLCRPLVAPWRLGVGRRAADPTPVGGGGAAVAASLDSSPPPRKPSIEMLPPPTAALAVGDVCPEPSTEDTLSTLETTPRRHQRRLST
jgi:hypothetical protein